MRVHGGKVPALFVVELVEGEHVAHRGHVDFKGPTGGGRHVGDPAVVAHHDAFAGFELGVHDVLKQVATGLLVVGLGVLEFLLHLRGDERVAVDLAVRVGEGDADFLAVVLEREDLLDAFHLGDFGGTEGPSLNHGAQAGDRQIGRQAVLVRVEADDFAAAGGELLLPQRVAVNVGHVLGDTGHAHHRGEAVLEHHDVVVGVRHFAVLVRVTGLAGGQRVALGGGAGAGGDRAVHTGGGHRDPVAGQRVAAHLRGGVRHFVTVGVQMRGETVVQRARVLELAGLGTGDELGVVVQVEEVTTVGKRRRRDADMLLRILPGGVVGEISHGFAHFPQWSRSGGPARAPLLNPWFWRRSRGRARRQ